MRGSEPVSPHGPLEHGEELNQFFVVLAARLANDQGGAPIPSRPRSVPKPAHTLRRLAPRYLVGLGLAALLGGGTLLHPGEKRTVPLPDGLLGTWRTSATGYEGRSFEIRRESVTLRAGPEGRNTTTLAIARVDTTQDEDGTNYILHYRPGGSESEFRFTYVVGPPGRVTLNHQSGIEWVQAGE